MTISSPVKANSSCGLHSIPEHPPDFLTFTAITGLTRNVYVLELAGFSELLA